MDDRRWRLLVPSPIRTLPADLTVIVAVTVLTLGAVFLPWLSETPIRILFGFAFVLFVPGYVLVAALFPAEGERVSADAENEEELGNTNTTVEATAFDGEGIDQIERVALSFGTSMAIVPLVGIVLNFTPWGIQLVPIMVALSAFVLLLVPIVVRRRRALPENERFTVSLWGSTTNVCRNLFRTEVRIDAVLNVALVLSILLAAASVGYVVTMPRQEETFTEFFLLTENENGDLVADDYPANLIAGEKQPLYVGISNHEGEPVRYTVVVELQRTQNNSDTVLEEEELRRFETRLQPNETWRLDHTIAPQMTGERLRLTYLLYKGSPPTDPSVGNAYREVHLWVNVSEPRSTLELTGGQRGS